MTEANGQSFPPPPMRSQFGAGSKRWSNVTYAMRHTSSIRLDQFKERKDQMNLVIQAPVTDATFEYQKVLVVGGQKKSYDRSRFKAGLLQLTRHVRGVFSGQPTYRFVHAFTLCASTMGLWVFDRSRPYSLGPFNIHEEPDKFARAVVGYTTILDDSMGLDTFIERRGGHLYLNPNDFNIRLDKAMVRQQAIVCRGTACYRTRDGDVAKFSWASYKREPEVIQLKRVEQRGVMGVAKAVAHHQITSIALIREGLEFPKPHWFEEEVHFEDLQSTSTSANTSGIKRKSSSHHTSKNTPENTSACKRRRSNSQRSTLATELNKQSSGSIIIGYGKDDMT